jgi:D-proline reductase (dithiol) PrdB
MGPGLERRLPARPPAGLAEQGVIGSVAAFHYSFMGATDPRELEDLTGQLASTMRKDGVDAALLIPI